MLKLKVNQKIFEYYKNNKSCQKTNFINDLGGFYILLTHKKETIKISYDTFLKVDNKKLKAIFINFTTSNNCPSKILGLCNYSYLCYSLSDEIRFKKSVYFKNLLNVLFIKKIMNDKKEYNKFIQYCSVNSNFLIRFNKDGDFKNKDDILFLNRVKKDTNNKLGGYTKRVDLLFNKDNLINKIEYHINISDYDYLTLYDLKEYLDNKDRCSGYCNNCLKCYNTHKKSYTLLHGALNKIDPIYNTKSNRLFIIETFNKIGLKLKEDDLKVNKGLLSSLNKVFNPYFKKEFKKDLKFKSYNDLLTFINYMGLY